MQDGLQIFTKGIELTGWMKEHDVIKDMGTPEADLLLAYVHKKGLEICADGGTKLLLYKSESRQPELMCDMDELIDIVEEWNFEQMKVCEGKIIAEDDTDKKAGYRREMGHLKKDAKILDRLFEQTRFARELDEMAARLAGQFIKGLQEKGLDVSAKQLAEAMRCETRGGGR